jgi:hypothetical protein
MNNSDTGDLLCKDRRKVRRASCASTLPAIRVFSGYRLNTPAHRYRSGRMVTLADAGC